MLEPERFERIIRLAPTVRVAVVGDLMLDVYLKGVVHRISPEAPVPVVQITEERHALGGAANVAANVVRMGATCDLVGFLGMDRAGDDLERGLRSLGDDAIRTRMVRSIERPTTTKTRVMARQQQVVRFDLERVDDLPAPLAQELLDQLRESVRNADVLVLEDYNKGVLSPAVIHGAIQAAHRAGIPVVVDPKFRHVDEYRGTTVFKPNVLELTTALGGPARLDDEGWLERARTRFQCDHLLVTCGEEGMVVKSEGEPPIHIAALARDVYDVSGAGDTVTAFVAVAVATGASIREAATLANMAAAIEVGKPGVATVHPDEVRELLANLHAETLA